MRLPLIFVASLVLGLFASVDVGAKKAPSRFADLHFQSIPQPPPLDDAEGSLYRAAAADTFVLGWWQFDTPSGLPTTQGWTAHDITTQAAKYWHVDSGGGSPCNGITPINGSKSMWCGQWSTSEYPWCGWLSLPGYGANWDQSLQSTANGSTVTYTIVWESEPGYDLTYVEWWDAVNSEWGDDANANGGGGSFSGTGGPLTETLTSPYGPTKVRFHFVSDGAIDDEDGNGATAEGAVKLDDLRLDAGSVEDWEGESCLAQQSNDGKWIATIPPGYGIYAALHHGTTLIQEDACFRQRSWLWGFFDDPSVTNYACGGWPLQGAMPYGPHERFLYMQNEIWSPWVPITGSGSEYILSFLTYRDLPLDNLQFYYYLVKTRDTDTGTCPHEWDVWYMVQYGGQKDWIRTSFQVGSAVPGGSDEIMVRLGAIDACSWWCGLYGDGACHSHAPLFDQVRLVRVNSLGGPQWTVRDIDLWQDNFPELGGIGVADYARCDMAQDILPGTKKGIVPGDSLKVVVSDPAGLATDNTGGRPGKAVYVFVRVTDRYGNPIPGKNGAAIQSPDHRAYAADPNAGMLRWPHVPGLAPAGWDAYRMDYAYTAPGGKVTNTFCCDLMDLAAGPDGPPYHQNENWAANTGIFAPGDVINYFFGAKNMSGVWSYWHRQYRGQGRGLRAYDIAAPMTSPCEWSVLPDVGRQPGDLGDILYVDDTDDRLVTDFAGMYGAPPQMYFDWSFLLIYANDRTDRFDILGSSSCVGNSLASRVKNVSTQLIGNPVETYQQVLWNSGELSRGLMCDGGTPYGGRSPDKSDDFALCYSFLNDHPNNPGWAYWGDDAAQDWNDLTGSGAVNVKNAFMNYTLVSGDQRAVSGVVSPLVYPTNPLPPSAYLRPTESFYSYGGCVAINDFDALGESGLSRASHRYADAKSGRAAALSQITPNGAATNARFFLAGFGYDVIRDDDLNGAPDRAKHLLEVLTWFQNTFPTAVGIAPETYANRLDNAYPNPFNPTTTIRYSIATSGHVSLKIYNAAGQLVRTFVDEAQVPASEGFSVTWDGTDNRGQGVSSGVYFYKLSANEYTECKKMVFLK
jgi:hypothetical protein